MKIRESKLRKMIRNVLVESLGPKTVEEIIAQYESQAAQFGPMAARFMQGPKGDFERWASGECHPSDPSEIGGIGPELGAQYAGWTPEDFQAVLDSGCFG